MFKQPGYLTASNPFKGPKQPKGYSLGFEG